MKPEHVAIGVGLVAVAAVAFVVGRSFPRQFRPPSPLTGGRPGAKAPGKTTTAPETPQAPKQVGSQVATAPSLGAKLPKPSTAPAASLIRGDTYQNPTLGIVIKKPQGDDWEMTDNRLNFRDPVRHPAKVLEIRRNPKDPTDKRFAIIELYVLDDVSENRARRQVEKFERLGQRAQVGKFTLVKEDTTTLGGKEFGRRVVRWESKKASAQFLTLWRFADGRLFVLMAMTDSKWFDDLLPEFNQTINALRVP